MYKINLLGQKDVMEFCSAANKLPDDIILCGKKHKYKVNAKSLIGCMLAMSEWGDDIWIDFFDDYYSVFEKWIEIATDDGNYIHK